MMNMNMKRIVFKKSTVGYFAHTPDDPQLIVLGEFIDDAMCFFTNVVNFLKDDSVESKGIQDFLIVKKGDTAIIFHDFEDIPELFINKTTLLNILEEFKKFGAADTPEIILSAENGIYTMTSQGNSVVIK